MSVRVYAGLSADQRSARRRQQLLDAGLEVFAERGWSGATVQDVCRTAALSPRYFYELFDGREALFVAVTSDIAARVQETVRTTLAVAGSDPEQRARAVLTALARFFTSDARMVRVALTESLATERLRAHRRALLEDFSSEAARLMRSLRVTPGRSAAARRRLELSATLLTGGMVEALIAWEGQGAELPTDLLVDHLTDLYVAAAQL